MCGAVRVHIPASVRRAACAPYTLSAIGRRARERSGRALRGRGSAVVGVGRGLGGGVLRWGWAGGAQGRRGWACRLP